MEIQPQEIACTPDKEKLHQVWLKIQWRRRNRVKNHMHRKEDLL